MDGEKGEEGEGLERLRLRTGEGNGYGLSKDMTSILKDVT